MCRAGWIGLISSEAFSHGERKAKDELFNVEPLLLPGKRSFSLSSSNWFV